MDALLPAVIIMFMMFLCALCLFAIVVILRDIIRENAKAKRELNREEDKAEIDLDQLAELIAKANASEPEPEKEEELPEVVVLEDEVEEPAPDDENAVVFSKQTLTIEERYATLSTEF